jgi:N-acetylglucosaminyldiphosphoundecaprenol N-acetyl-beta-D-mannosaminyltransferase
MGKRADIFGCRFDALSETEVLLEMLRWRDQPKRRSHIVVTVNVGILMMMRADAALARAIHQADLVVADGMPLVWVSRWLGAPLPERVTGVDLMQRLLEAGAARGLRIYLLGATQERLEALVQMIHERYPGVAIVGARNGYFDPAADAELVADIRAARADLLLLGMPAPFKEIWCEKRRAELDTPAILGVGGAFDVLSGFVPRAPRLLQQLGAEWAWRLAMEPGKLWKRYLVRNSQFLYLLAKTLVTRTLRRGGDTAIGACDTSAY